MKITTKAHYGLMAMCELARRYGQKPVSVRQIAELQNCSNSYMEQLFALLKKGGLIKSNRGAYGGYTLVRPPEEISMNEIITTLEGPIGFTDCSSEKPHNCSNSHKCSAQAFWRELSENISSFLENKKLSEFIEN